MCCLSIFRCRCVAASTCVTAAGMTNCWGSSLCLLLLPLLLSCSSATRQWGNAVVTCHNTKQGKKRAAMWSEERSKRKRKNAASAPQQLPYGGGVPFGRLTAQASLLSRYVAYLVAFSFLSLAANVIVVVVVFLVIACPDLWQQQSLLPRPCRSVCTCCQMCACVYTEKTESQNKMNSKRATTTTMTLAEQRQR